MRGTGVGDAHENAPEDHGDGGVEEIEKARWAGCFGAAETEVIRQTTVPFFHFLQEGVELLVGS